MPTAPIAIPHNSVPAHVVHDFGDYEDREHIPAGLVEFCDAYSGEKDVAILFGCPCGCGSLQAVNIKPMDNHPTWNWNGNREQPTLTPSILIHQLDDKCNKIGEHWHGFLTAGDFKSC